MTMVQQWYLRIDFATRLSAQAEPGRQKFDVQFSTNEWAQECGS
jgi:hypothetical protein